MIFFISCSSPQGGIQQGGHPILGYLPLLFIISIFIMIKFFKHQRKVKAERQREIKTQEEEQRKYESKQIMILRDIKNQINQSNKIYNNLPNLIDQADNFLDIAQKEFSEGAFAPFWDAIENSVNLLARFNDGVQKIIINSNSYSTEIMKYDSQPPVFNIDTKKFPAASNTASRLKDIVRTAQKNFQFATIYEQRKTNQILVAGFASLGQAISDLGYYISDSINNLSSSVNELSRCYEERSQQVINEMQMMRDENQSDSETRSKHEKKVESDIKSRRQFEKEIKETVDDYKYKRGPFYKQ